MAAYQVKSHPVTAFRIASVGPLMARGQVMSPNAGLLLALDNQTTHRWLSEKDGYTPVVGDFFVTDDELKISLIIPAAKFGELFVA